MVILEFGWISANFHGCRFKIVPPQDFEVNEVSKRSELIILMEGSYESFLSSLAPSSAAKYRVRIEQFETYCKIHGFEIIPSSVQTFIIDLHEKYMVSTL